MPLVVAHSSLTFGWLRLGLFMLCLRIPLARDCPAEHFLFLVESDELVWQQFLPAWCAGRKTVPAVVNDGLDLETMMHPAALQGREP